MQSAVPAPIVCAADALPNKDTAPNRNGHAIHQRAAAAMKGKRPNDQQHSDAAVYIISMLVVAAIGGTIFTVLLIKGVIR